MGLTNFIARRLPAISAAWLNLVDNYIIGPGAKAPNERTALEVLYNITPVNLAFPPGDIRRQVLNAAQQLNWYCYGHAPTFVNTTTFTMVGDVTALYRPHMRVLALNGSGVTADMRLVSSTFAAGVTTVVLVNDNSQLLSSPMVAVAVQVSLSASGPSIMTYDNNISSGAGLNVANRNTGATASSRIQVHALNASGVATSGIVIASIPATYVGAYLINGYASGNRNAIYTALGTTLEFGTSDTSRLRIASDGSVTALATDLVISNGDGAANNTQVTVGAVQNARVALTVAGVERAFLGATNTPEGLVGTNQNHDFSVVVNGARALTFRGGNTTGGATPTLSANKPGANAGVIEWVAVRTTAGTVGWMPIFGN